MSTGASPRLSNYPFGFAQGVNILGMPIVNTYGGKVWWVSSLSGADGNPGTHSQPFATIARAFTVASGTNGDIVMVKAGHVESVASATAMVFATAGVQVIGLGQGAQRPTITLTTANTATIGIQAANISFSNILFVANFLAIASLFTLTNAPGFTLFNCEFRDTSSVLNFVAIVTTDTTSNHADDLTITNCRFIGLGTSSNTTFVSMLGSNNRVSLQNNYTSIKAITGAQVMPIATGKVVLDFLCTDNIFNLTEVSSLTTGILITTDQTTNTGMIARNLIQGQDATTEILVTASSGLNFSQNFYSGAADKSGYLLPAADA